MNITVLHGTLAREPKHRLLPSGDELITYEVTTEHSPTGRRVFRLPGSGRAALPPSQPAMPLL